MNPPIQETRREVVAVPSQPPAFQLTTLDIAPGDIAFILSSLPKIVAIQ